MVATTAGCLREWKRVYIYIFSIFFFKRQKIHNAGNEKWYEHEPQTVALGSKPPLVTQIVANRPGYEADNITVLSGYANTDS